MAVQPEDRFQTAAEFLDAIENQLVVDLPPQPGQAAEAPAKKKVKPAMIGGIAAAVLALVIGVGVLGGGGSSSDSGESNSMTPLIKAEVPSITIAGQEYSTDLRELRLESMYLANADIEPLKYMVNLTSLDLRQNNITDLTPLAGLTQLKSLELRGNNLSDLSPLAGLTNLETLRLGGSGTGLDNPNISDLSPLAGLHQLQTLCLPRQASIGDLSALADLVNLKNLTMDGVSSDTSREQITDLSPLKSLTQLETLHLFSCGTDDLSPLAGLTHLTELRLLGAMSVSDLSPLSGLTELRTLELTAQGNELMELESLVALQDLTKLESLRIYGDGTLSLKGLENMASLQTLFLSQHNSDFACVDIEELSNLTGLLDVTLWIDERSTNMAPLSNLTNLRYLYLYAWNVPAVSDLSFLNGMDQLQSLTLYESTVTDISPLRSLNNLQTLSIREYGEKITDWSPVDHVPNVTKE